jgi:hypothetical protein
VEEGLDGALVEVLSEMSQRGDNCLLIATACRHDQMISHYISQYNTSLRTYRDKLIPSAW